MKDASFIKEGIPTLNATNVSTIYQAEIIDVRMPDEYTGELGHIKNSRLVTLGPLVEYFQQLSPQYPLGHRKSPRLRIVSQMQ
jgi:rhodanese-related sulfurtransferase